MSSAKQMLDTYPSDFGLDAGQLALCAAAATLGLGLAAERVVGLAPEALRIS